MKKNKEINSKFLKILPLILFGIVLIVGIAYGFISANFEGKRTHEIIGDNITFSYTEQSNDLSINITEAISDEEGKNLDNYFEFQVQGTSPVASTTVYNIYLTQIIENDSIPEEAIKGYLTSVSSNVETEKLEPTVLNTLTALTGVNNSRILFSDSFIFDGLTTTSETRAYRLRTWIDPTYNLGNLVTAEINTSGEQIYNFDSYTFKYKVNVNVVFATENKTYTTPGSYTYAVPTDGYYEVELSGAQGGVEETRTTFSTGVLTKGYVYLKQGEILYIYVGGSGNSGSGYNGGGSGGTASIVTGYIGGGATDIRCFYNSTTQLCESNTSNLAASDALGLKSRIMVAAGGGGKGYGGYDTAGTSKGGGLIGYIGSYYGGHGDLSQYGRGGTQTTGGVGGTNIYNGTGTPYSGTFGLGGNSDTQSSGAGAGGGGGGYYGGGAGGATQNNGNGNGGGGGSSFISGYAGVNAINSSGTHTNNTMHYSGKYFIGGEILEDANQGNGKAKITYTGTSAPTKTTTNLNNVRYIKDCAIGSNDSVAQGEVFWSQVQAILNGYNVALNKDVIDATVPYNTARNAYSTLTDGTIISVASDYAYGSSAYGTEKCITVDLGTNSESDDGLWDLDEVVVWHIHAPYFPTYKQMGNTIQVSSDKSTWITIESSEVTETSLGKRISAY